MSNPPAYTPTSIQNPSNVESPKPQTHIQPPQSAVQPQPLVQPPPVTLPQPEMLPPHVMSVEQAGEQYRTQLFAQCAQGIHDPDTKYGVCGIITAVVCFPIGLICLFTDTEQRCHRCGVRLDK
ncbi:hypothetical protein C8J55DRAFT_517635 [Lentinula edodes]|nr:hypothetical protein C8J55DRAFT_517635 [Lentinula edodes]